MKIALFGAGPLPVETSQPFSIAALRTWQILRIVAAAMDQTANCPEIVVVAEEREPRKNLKFPTEIELPGIESVRCSYYGVAAEAYDLLGTGRTDMAEFFPQPPIAVIGSGSAVASTVAARFCMPLQVPFWADFCNVPCVAEVDTPTEAFRGTLPVLLRGDVFTASEPHGRLALIGQLGVAGRLNQFTSGQELVHVLPCGLFPDEFPPRQPPPQKTNFILLSVGGVTPHCDVETFVRGFEIALQKEPRLRLVIIPSRPISDIGAETLKKAFAASSAKGAIQVLPRCTYAEMRKLCSVADAGLVIEDHTYGSQMNSCTGSGCLLACGKPILAGGNSDAVIRLLEQPFGFRLDMESADAASASLLRLAESAERLQELGLDAAEWAKKHMRTDSIPVELREWILTPKQAPDKHGIDHPETENHLAAFWQRFVQT